MADFSVHETPLTPGMYLGSRPLRVNQRNGLVTVQTERGLTVNSLLRKDEWRLLDTEVQKAAQIRLRAVEMFRRRGLVKRINSFGTLVSQYNKANEMTAANVSMTGQGESERDRVENKIGGVPIPIIYKDFNIPKRQLEAARLMGNQLDTEHASAAARVVAEGVESLLVNGSSSTIFDGYTLYGLTTETNRNTGSATGDWGTSSNIPTTVTAMIAAAVADRYYGPYALHVASPQYTELTTQFFTDGSGQSALQRIKQIPELEEVIPDDTLAAGSLVLHQLTADVADMVEHMGVTVVEWMSGDGMVAHFRVMAVAAPRIKSDYATRSGVVHYTGA